MSNVSITYPCNIVLPIHNNLALVIECIESLLQWTSPAIYHLYIIDDHSDSVTSNYLVLQAKNYPHITLHRNTENIGFVQSCNHGIALGNASYIVLLNSDVVVTPDWLERLIKCAESDSRIGSVNPLTNHASQINLPIAPGANFYGMDEIVREKFTSDNYPDVVTGVGFCILLRRSALEQVGVFDEVYGKGYCEESDLCMRLTTSGYRTVVAQNVYVYHKGRSSFRDRGERYHNNRKIFDARWAAEYKRQFRSFQKENPLKPVRDFFRLPQCWDPMPVIWETARDMNKFWQQRHFVSLLRRGVQGSLQLIRNSRNVSSPESIAGVTRSGRLRVTYVLHDLVIAGGVLSVIQLVNELVLLGVEARIVALYQDPALVEWTRLYTCPIIFKDQDELIQNFPETDIAVATIWNTAEWVDRLVKSGQAGCGVYFLQDYEPWFLGEEEKEKRRRVLATFDQIENKIVKSDWLQGMLEKDGYSARKITLGMDLARFYPREVATSGRPVVLAMARPGTPRRGFRPVIEALALVKEAMPECEIVLFGDRFLSYKKIPFQFRDEGIVISQDRLAELYSEADVFLDGSDFQGFGRCALEAMACGAACVLTGVGGVTEYARHGENTLVVPPASPDRFAEGVLDIISNDELKEKLVAGGLNTAKQYCHKREARETLAYFMEICEHIEP